MKKSLAILGLLLLTASAGLCQNRSNFSGIYNAYDFAYGQNPGAPALLALSGSTGTGSYAVTLAYGYYTTASGAKVYPFSLVSGATSYIPVQIGGGLNIETVTPTAVSCLTPEAYGTCSFTATFTYSHGNGDQVRSGDFGLQEAANYAAGIGGGLVAVDWTWFKANGLTTNAGLTTKLATYNSLSPNVTILNYGGISGALSYTAAQNSAYASSTHVLY